MGFSPGAGVPRAYGVGSRLSGSVEKRWPRQGPTRSLLVTSAFHMHLVQRLFERQGLKALPFLVDFQARGRWAEALWHDSTQWLLSARALDDSSLALCELIGRFLYRTW